MGSVKRILIAPLDWGLGHASRCIPLIRYLIQNEQEVYLAGTGRSGELLGKEFPDLPFLELPAYRYKYSSGKSQVLAMLGSIPRILRDIREEHRLFQELQHKYRFDAVISDNRYGLYHSQTLNILITHQLMLKMPARLKVAEPIVTKLLHRLIKPFHSCWIPDAEGSSNLSGDLSHRYSAPVPSRFIGPLSRFHRQDPLSTPTTDLLVVLSGPEPQRMLLERKLTKLLKDASRQTVMVAGKTEGMEKDEKNGNIQIRSYLKSNELLSHFRQAKMVISRCGYSTIMDLVALQKEALLIPTPGQTEQEYLAGHLAQSGLFRFIKQDDLSLGSLTRSSPPARTWPDFSFDQYQIALDEMLDDLTRS